MKNPEREQRLSLLHVLAERDGYHYVGLYQCSCGKTHKARMASVKAGMTRSCGCLVVERMRVQGPAQSRANRTHGETKTYLYKLWGSVVKRCTNKKCESYPRYGGRLLVPIEPLWQTDFVAFRDAINTECGPRPSRLHSIERKDNDLGYIPGNVRWADRWEQASNKSNNVHLTHDGKTQTLSQWARERRMSCELLHRRLNKLGWDLDKALDTPVTHYRPRKPKP